MLKDNIIMDRGRLACIMDRGRPARKLIKIDPMCRNIKKLRKEKEEPTDAELHDAALQFVRKISGFRAPSQANQEAFDQAVQDVAKASRKMFGQLRTGRSQS